MLRMALPSFANCVQHTKLTELATNRSLDGHVPEEIDSFAHHSGVVFVRPQYRQGRSDCTQQGLDALPTVAKSVRSVYQDLTSTPCHVRILSRNLKDKQDPVQCCHQGRTSGDKYGMVVRFPALMLP